jgi:RNA polymerase sigma-70 factor (ECF subfamily)
LQDLFAPNDEQLMWRVQTQDDPTAFARLVERWQEPIRRLCARITGDIHRAEDLAQEIFTKLFLNRQAYRQGSRLSTYLWRIALNHCYNDLRRPHRRHETPLDPADPYALPPEDRFAADDPTPAEDLVSTETAAAVRLALATLPDGYRSVLVLRHYENLKFREIADVLDLPEGTVKTRMTEALSELARRLRKPLDLPINPGPGKCGRLRDSLVL